MFGYRTSRLLIKVFENVKNKIVTTEGNPVVLGRGGYRSFGVGA
jgi:hypothetical protein